MMRSRLIHKLFPLATILIVTTSLAKAAEQRITNIYIEGLHHIREEIVRNLLPIHEGDIFHIADIDQSVDYLRRWGVFHTINTSLKQEPKGVSVLFQLEEAKVITLINLEGNYPYIENRIRKYLTLHPGESATPDTIKHQQDILHEFYEREGFVGPNVTVDEDYQPDLDGIDLTFYIHRGDLLRYDTITVTGNYSYPKGRIISAVNPLKPYVERRLRTSLRKVTEFYHHHGYPKARVRVLKKEIDFSRRRVNLGIEVREGPHVAVRFYGNHHIRDRTLKKIITFFREGSFDTYETELSVKAIREAYLIRGFPDVTIDAQQKNLQGGNFLVTFDIDEGQPQTTKRINFVGNDHVSEKHLRRKMRNQSMRTGERGRYLPEAVSQDQTSITQALHEEGFLEAHVGEWDVRTTPQGFSHVITIPINEGTRTVIKEIIFSGNQNAESKELLHVLRFTPGKPFHPSALDDERQQLLVYYADHGYPYAEIRHTTSVDAASHTATLHYDIDEGTEVRIGEILIVGDVLTSQKAIKRAMQIRPGDLFSYRKVLEAQLNIRRLGPFAAVNIETIGLAEKEKFAHLRVKIEEQRPLLTDLEFGYSTDQRIAGSLKFTNLNAFGWAKRNTLALTAGQELSRVDLGWLDPRFFGSSFEMSTNGWFQYKQEPAFTFIQVGSAFGWFRRFQRLGFLARVELDRNYFLEGSSAAADAQSLRDNTITKVTLSSSYDTRDSFSDPHHGFFTIGGADFFNELGGNQASFMRISSSFEYDYSPFRWVTIASAARFHHLRPLDANVSIPSNELLFLGGDDTVRGFAEDRIGPVDITGKAIGGRVRWIVNEEIRWRLTSNLSLAAFYDAGELTNALDDLAIGNTRHATGFGIRYLTPVGPIRADYGLKLNRRSGEAVGRFHLTFGYVF